MGLFRHPLRLIQTREEYTMRLNQRTCRLTLRAAFVALAMLLGVMLADPVLADDGKAYPGSVCKESVDGFHQTRASGDIVFDFDGNALNISTSSTRYVSCPLVRDGELPQGVITYAAVSYYKASSVGLMCQVVSQEYFGGASKVGEAKWDFSAGGTDRRLMELPLPAASSVSGGYSIWCVLPQTVTDPNGKVEKTGIAHYGIVESGVSD
jgi:hypothetical protein